MVKNLAISGNCCTFADETKKEMIINMKQEIIDYLDSLSKDDCLAIIKYGLRGSNAPEDVNVEDIFTKIGCLYINDTEV